MKRGFSLLLVLLLGAPAASHAFTLDIVSHEGAEFDQGPSSIFVPGYGEVVFESGLDGALVVDSAYASTEQIELPPLSGIPVAEASKINAGPDTNPGFVEIANRGTHDLSSPLQVALHPVDVTLQNPPGGWNAVPEAASATLGLIGTLILLLRRHAKTMSPAPGKP